MTIRQVRGVDPISPSRIVSGGTKKAGISGFRPISNCRKPGRPVRTDVHGGGRRVAGRRGTAIATDLDGEIPPGSRSTAHEVDLGGAIGRLGFEALLLAEAVDSGRDGRSVIVGWTRPATDGRPVPSPSSAEFVGTGDLGERWTMRALTERAGHPGPDEADLLRRLCRLVGDRVGGDVAAPSRARKRPLLSRRERECLEWTAAGKTTWEIAGILEISQNTVDGYIASAGRKLGAVNRTQAVAEALRRGLIA